MSNATVAIEYPRYNPSISSLIHFTRQSGESYPIAVSSTFGLLHGFGFAAVLTEIGLPQTEIPTALLFFNIGVEIGQIIFVLAALAIFFIVKTLFISLRTMTFCEVLSSIQRPSGYIVGTLAMLWTIERVVLF